MDFSAPRKSQLSAPQLQGQLSRLIDRTRLRWLKSTLLSKGAWQASDKNRRPCHTQASHNWLYHLDACVGSVLPPHDYITNVQKKNSATDFGWVVGSVDAAVSSQTWNMQKHAAQPKLRGDTTRAFTLCFVV